MSEGLGKQNPLSTTPYIFVDSVGHTTAYPEKMTRSTGLSGVLPLRAVYLSVGESEVAGLKVRRCNSTSAFLGTFKLFA